MYSLKKLLAAFVLFGFSLSAFAQNPDLQIDISGGTYVGGAEESVMTSADSFTTYVYGDASAQSKVEANKTDTYYMSVAIVSADGTSITNTLSDIGSFTIDGTTYTLASMTYGTPPLDAAYKDLQSHSIYDTYYLEMAFNFDTSTQYASQNVQDNPGGPTAGTGMYAQAFDISKAGLADGYELHFDAYHLGSVKSCYDPAKTAAEQQNCLGKVDIFAPFSHDGGTYTVSETSSLLLLMVGLFGLVGFKRKNS